MALDEKLMKLTDKEILKLFLERDSDAIYEYAMQRSKEIQTEKNKNLTKKTVEELQAKDQAHALFLHPRANFEFHTYGPITHPEFTEPTKKELIEVGKSLLSLEESMLEHIAHKGYQKEPQAEKQEKNKNPTKSKAFNFLEIGKQPTTFEKLKNRVAVLEEKIKKLENKTLAR